MKTYKIIRGTHGAFVGVKFNADEINCEELSLAVNRRVKKVQIKKIKEGLYSYSNNNYTLIIREEK